MTIQKHALPERGLKGFLKHWRNDLIAAFSVALVALPLSLGIAIASGMQPMSGIIAAVVGGVVTTLYRGGYVSINGPAAGLIAVVYAAIQSLEDGSGNGINYMLAAVVISGLIQVSLGLLKLGKFANAFPSSVIHGMLAAIGIIILSKQLFLALGIPSDAESSIGIITDTLGKLHLVNPFIAMITLASLLLLIYHARISYKLFHFLPAPVWVLVIAIPFVYFFNFFEPHSISFLNKVYEVGPDLLISIPDNPLDALMFPDFAKIGTGVFWMAVLSITLISSLETLAIAKAIDKLDPYKRVTDSNKDLIGNGLATLVCGCIGGLPIIPVIARSSVNINNNAKTRWSNLYNAVFILIFVLLLAPMIQKVPLAALAAILVYTGYKLAAPRVFRAAYEQGMEQLLFLSATVIITLYTDLLYGILGGILLTLLVHVLLSRLPADVFFKMIFRSQTRLEVGTGNRYHLRLDGVANFLSIIKINELLASIPVESVVEIDLSKARLIDLTVQERLEDFKMRHELKGGQVHTVGQDSHVASSYHPWALKSLIQALPPKLTPRQKRFKDLAIKNQWDYSVEQDRNTSYLLNFQFFETRPIERKSNVLSARYTELGVGWTISDITFDEGAFMATEIYNTTAEVIHLPFKIPKFILEKEGFFDKVFDRVMEISGQRDIDFKLFTKFSKKFLLKGEDEIAIRDFFNENLILFLEQKEIYHIESNGEALLLFKYLRPARAEEVTKMLDFSKALIQRFEVKV